MQSGEHNSSSKTPDKNKDGKEYPGAIPLEHVIDNPSGGGFAFVGHPTSLPSRNDPDPSLPHSSKDGGGSEPTISNTATFSLAPADNLQPSHPQLFVQPSVSNNESVEERNYVSGVEPFDPNLLFLNALLQPESEVAIGGGESINPVPRQEGLAPPLDDLSSISPSIFFASEAVVQDDSSKVPDQQMEVDGEVETLATNPEIDGGLHQQLTFGSSLQLSCFEGRENHTASSADIPVDAPTTSSDVDENLEALAFIPTPYSQPPQQSLSRPPSPDSSSPPFSTINIEVIRSSEVEMVAEIPNTETEAAVSSLPQFTPYLWDASSTQPAGVAYEETVASCSTPFNLLPTASRLSTPDSTSSWLNTNDRPTSAATQGTPLPSGSASKNVGMLGGGGGGGGIGLKGVRSGACKGGRVTKRGKAPKKKDRPIKPKGGLKNEETKCTEESATEEAENAGYKRRGAFRLSKAGFLKRLAVLKSFKSLVEYNIVKPIVTEDLEMFLEIFRHFEQNHKMIKWHFPCTASLLTFEPPSIHANPSYAFFQPQFSHGTFFLVASGIKKTRGLFKNKSNEIVQGYGVVDGKKLPKNTRYVSVLCLTKNPDAELEIKNRILKSPTYAHIEIEFVYLETDQQKAFRFNFGFGIPSMLFVFQALLWYIEGRFDIFAVKAKMEDSEYDDVYTFMHKKLSVITATEWG